MCCLESWISLAKSAVFQINKFKIQKVCQKSVFVCGQKKSKIQKLQWKAALVHYLKNEKQSIFKIDSEILKSGFKTDF